MDQQQLWRERGFTIPSFPRVQRRKRRRLFWIQLGLAQPPCSKQEKGAMNPMFLTLQPHLGPPMFPNIWMLVVLLVNYIFVTGQGYSRGMISLLGGPVFLDMKEKGLFALHIPPFKSFLYSVSFHSLVPCSLPLGL